MRKFFIGLLSVLLCLAVLVSVFTLNIEGEFSFSNYVENVCEEFPVFPSFSNSEDLDDTIGTYDDPDTNKNIFTMLKDFITFIFNLISFPVKIVIWLLRVAVLLLDFSSFFTTPEVVL